MKPPRMTFQMEVAVLWGLDGFLVHVVQPYLVNLFGVEDDLNF